MKARNYRFSKRRSGRIQPIALVLAAAIVGPFGLLGLVAYAQKCTPGTIVTVQCFSAHLDNGNCIEIDDQTITPSGRNAHSPNAIRTPAQEGS